ncbi:hypothetical protein HanXRQr2_Chr13g0598751 [Helianthus annuus]|uniref:Uncharacterized protein n=2 Tax=Helianthus annuus TaxID=4232 RepID=A0A9K3EJB0_HELAN|nr:hypothetical protein HanXRQr2_Chr13g0598751 [Helianthus annuus]
MVNMFLLLRSIGLTDKGISAVARRCTDLEMINSSYSRMPSNYIFRAKIHCDQVKTGHIKNSKMPFSSLRFCQFCDFRPKVFSPHLDPKGLKSCHFHPAC